MRTSVSRFDLRTSYILFAFGLILHSKWFVNSSVLLLLVYANLMRQTGRICIFILFACSPHSDLASFIMKIKWCLSDAQIVRMSKCIENLLALWFGMAATNATMDISELRTKCHPMKTWIYAWVCVNHLFIWFHVMIWLDCYAHSG